MTLMGAKLSERTKERLNNYLKIFRRFKLTQLSKLYPHTDYKFLAVMPAMVASSALAAPSPAAALASTWGDG